MTAAARRLSAADLYALVKRIPRGKVATYGQLARLLGMPRHARHVGHVLAILPVGIEIPWHRVVNSAGRISQRLANWQGDSERLQRIRLEDEGVRFSPAGIIDLETFGWHPRRRA